MNHNFKLNYLQNDTYIVVSKMEESIPKGIILYYSLVFILCRLLSDKEKFAGFPFFSFLKKIELLYMRFFSGLTGLKVLFPLSQGFRGTFLRPLPRPLRPQAGSKIATTVKKNYHDQKSKIGEILLRKIVGNNHRNGVACFLSENVKSKILESI
jgi:hypothetical protein